MNNNSFLWFLMAIRDPTMLEVMPKTQEYMLKGPPADIKRRFENLTKSVEGKHFQVTCVKSPSLPSFLNFEIYANSAGELNPPRDVFVIPSPISASSGNIQEIRSRVRFALNESSKGDRYCEANETKGSTKLYHEHISPILKLYYEHISNTMTS